VDEWRFFLVLAPSTRSAVCCYYDLRSHSSDVRERGSPRLFANSGDEGLAGDKKKGAFRTLEQLGCDLPKREILARSWTYPENDEVMTTGPELREDGIRWRPDVANGAPDLNSIRIAELDDISNNRIGAAHRGDCRADAPSPWTRPSRLWDMQRGQRPPRCLREGNCQFGAAPRNRSAGDGHENIEPRPADRKPIDATRDSYRKWPGEAGCTAGDLLMEATAFGGRFATDKEHAVALARFGGNGFFIWLLNPIDDFDGIAGAIGAIGGFGASCDDGFCVFGLPCALRRRLVGAIVQMEDRRGHSPGAGKKPDHP
jgi:hypothetical protein